MAKAGSCLQTDLGPPVIPAQQARHCKNPRKLPEEPQCLNEVFSGFAWLPCTSPSPKSHPGKSKGSFLPNSSSRVSGTSLTVGIRHQSLLQLSAFPSKILKEIFVCRSLHCPRFACICDWHLSSLEGKCSQGGEEGLDECVGRVVGEGDLCNTHSQQRDEPLEARRQFNSA